MASVSPLRDPSPGVLPEVSYLLLGLIERAGEATPYELKQMAASVAGLWTLRHDQVYREPQRLAELGPLEEERAEHGPRRRRLRVPAAGRKALTAWLATPHPHFTE